MFFTRIREAGAIIAEFFAMMVEVIGEFLGGLG